MISFRNWSPRFPASRSGLARSLSAGFFPSTLLFPNSKLYRFPIRVAVNRLLTPGRSCQKGYVPSQDLKNVADDLVKQRQEKDMQDLMEDFNEYTELLAHVRTVTRNVDGYSQNLSADSIDIAIESLSSAQVSMREEQNRIISAVSPHCNKTFYQILTALFHKMSQIQSSLQASLYCPYMPPSQWRRRLPVRIPNCRTKISGRSHLFSNTSHPLCRFLGLALR